MKPERELERHNRILEQIKEATTIEELPKIGPSTITAFLATNVYFNGIRRNPAQFKSILDVILKEGTFCSPRVYMEFEKLRNLSFGYLGPQTLERKYLELKQTKRIDYILEEIDLKNKKIEELNKAANKEAHKEIMGQIIAAYDVKELPKVGLSELNRKILRCFNNNDYSNRFKTSDIKSVTEAYLKQASDGEIVILVMKAISKSPNCFDFNDRMISQIVNNLSNDETIRYTVEEIRAKEKRELEIYKLNHEETMENIRNAKRISQLPPKLSFSTLTDYLCGNSTIYPNDNRMKAEDLKKLAELLLTGCKWEDGVVRREIYRISYEKYPDKERPSELLYDKLSALPRTYYIVEEVRYALERQREFIQNQDSKVNVYFIANEKSPVKGGKFYNCYISRGENLDLSEVLPARINPERVPAGVIDSIEWYVQEYADPTFKTAGGIILNRDETIGNVSVFKQNDGTIGVSPEDKAKMDTITDLDREIAEKQKLVQSLDIVIATKQQTSSELESKIKQALINYEKQVLGAQRQLVEHMTQLKNEFGTEETIEEIGGISYTYDKKD